MKKIDKTSNSNISLDITDSVIKQLEKDGYLKTKDNGVNVRLTHKGVLECNKFFETKLEMSNLLWIRFLDILQNTKELKEQCII